MWLNGGYYYRGMLYRKPEALAALTAHLNGPPAPTENTGNELSWQAVFTFLEGNMPGKTSADFSGEDWPQPIGTWDAIYYCHNAVGDDGSVTIPEADDRRREKDFCPCMVARDKSPDCDLPNYHRPGMWDAGKETADAD